MVRPVSRAGRARARRARRRARAPSWRAEPPRVYFGSLSDVLLCCFCVNTFVPQRGAPDGPGWFVLVQMFYNAGEVAKLLNASDVVLINYGLHYCQPACKPTQP